MMKCNLCRAEILDNAPYCPDCGALTYTPTKSSIWNTANVENFVMCSINKKLKWYHFTIYVRWLYNLITSIICILGICVILEDHIDTYRYSYYNFNAISVYICLANILIYLIPTIMMTIARFELARFSKNGVQALFKCYIIDIVLTVLIQVLLVALAQITLSQAIAEIFGVCVGVLIIWIPERIYYKKREFLFIN